MATRLLHDREGVERAARAGLAGKGVLYGILGILAAQVALRGGGDQASQSGAIRAVAQQPFGTVLLVLLALGLTGYALWRLAQVAVGPVTRSELPGPLLRLSFLLRGLGYGAIAALAWRTVVTGSSGGGGGQEQRWTRQVLELPFGVPLVVAIGAVVVAVGLYQAKQALGRDFLGSVDTAAMTTDGRAWFERLGVAGHLARAVVYGLVGYFLIQAALSFRADDVGLGAALAELASAPFGTAVLLVVALGLILYGAFCVVMSRYARVHQVT